VLKDHRIAHGQILPGRRQKIFINYLYGESNEIFLSINLIFDFKFNNCGSRIIVRHFIVF